MNRLLKCALILGMFAPATGAQAQTATPSDLLFLRSEARSSAYELAIAQLGQQRASAPAVKAFADTLVTDHEGDAAALRDLGTKKGVTLAMDLSEQSKAALQHLARQSRRGFDRAFLAEARRVNAAATRAFRLEASRTADPDIQKFVAAQMATDTRHDATATRLAQNGPARPGDMPVIRPPMGGAMPVIPPPSGGATPVIPPQR